jgi:hypothetical protein
VSYEAPNQISSSSSLVSIGPIEKVTAVQNFVSFKCTFETQDTECSNKVDLKLAREVSVSQTTSVTTTESFTISVSLLCYSHGCNTFFETND